MSVQKKICDLNIEVTDDALKLTASGKANYINLTDGEKLTANRSLGDQLQNNIELPIMHYTEGDTKLEEIQTGQDNANLIQAISSAVACIKVTSVMMENILNSLSTSGIRPQRDCYVCLYANYAEDFAALSKPINNVNVGFHLFADATVGKLLNINDGTTSGQGQMNYLPENTTDWGTGTTNKKAGYPSGYHQHPLTTDDVNYIYVRAKRGGFRDDTAKDYLCILVKTGVNLTDTGISFLTDLANENLDHLQRLITQTSVSTTATATTATATTATATTATATRFCNITNNNTPISNIEIRDQNSTIILPRTRVRVDRNVFKTVISNINGNDSWTYTNGSDYLIVFLEDSSNTITSVDVTIPDSNGRPHKSNHNEKTCHSSGCTSTYIKQKLNNGEYTYVLVIVYQNISKIKNNKLKSFLQTCIDTTIPFKFMLQHNSQRNKALCLSDDKLRLEFKSVPRTNGNLGIINYDNAHMYFETEGQKYYINSRGGISSTKNINDCIYKFLINEKIRLRNISEKYLTYNSNASVSFADYKRNGNGGGERQEWTINENIGWIKPATHQLLGGISNYEIKYNKI